jgi:hypothetical protein
MVMCSCDLLQLLPSEALLSLSQTQQAFNQLLMLTCAQPSGNVQQW